MNVFLHPERGPLHLGRSKRSDRSDRAMLKFAKLHMFLEDIVAPESLDNTGGVTSWGMMLNDNLGDCTCATLGHMEQIWTGDKITVPDAAILAAYEAVGGYVPGNESTDQGAQIVDALNYFRDSGVGGHKIQTHAEVNLTQERIQQAVWVFGCVDVGIQLPMSAQSQVGSLWDFAGEPDQAGGWGGHSVPIVAYDASGLTCVTWGALQKMTWRWFMYYADEAHAAISPDDSAYPVDMNQLAADLETVGT